MIFRDEEVYQTFSLWLHNYRLYRQTVRYIFIAILLSILVLEAYIRLWLRIRLFGVIYQICELFLILWTLLCKEWNCDFLITKGYTWRYSPCISHLKGNYSQFSITDGFSFLSNCNSFLKKGLVPLGASFQERNTIEIRTFWHYVHANRNSFMNHIFPLENYHFDLSKRRKTCKAEGGLSTLKS